MPFMRRLCGFAMLVLLALAFQLSPVPVFAQHGGGHGGGGGGHSGGFGGGHGGGFSGHSSFSGHSGYSAPSSGVHAYSGPLSRGYTPRYSAPLGSYSRGPAYRAPQSSYTGRVGSWEPLGSWNRFSGSRFSGNHTRGGVGITIRTRGFFGPWRYGYSGWYGYYDPYWYDPYWLWDSSSYDDDQNNYVDGAYDGPYQDYAQGGPGYDNEQALEEQSARENGEQDYYARSQPREPLHAELTAPSPPTTLVFRDQHKEEIQNYAIVGQTLWSFSDQRTQKIPLSDLDIPATQKANEEHGVNFRVPAPGEGQ